MRKHLFTTLILLGLLVTCSKAQTIDTLLDVGGYRLNFHIVKGAGMPILFESGSGADVTVWDSVLKPISDITHATLITYDRPGFGKSDLDTSNQDLDKHGILQGIEALETGLKKLGYDKEIMLIAHSFGGFCATLYAARHPSIVKSAVLVDCNHVCWFTEEYVNTQMKERERKSTEMKMQNLASYYQSLNLRNTVELLKKSPFPPNIPVIDLVADNVPAFPDSAGMVRWKACHKQFAEMYPSREGITASGCGHFIFRDNPLLFITAVVKAYVGPLQIQQRAEIMKRFLSFNLRVVND